MQWIDPPAGVRECNARGLQAVLSAQPTLRYRRMHVTVRRKHVVVDQLDRVGARARVRVLEAGAGARHHAVLKLRRASE